MIKDCLSHIEQEERHFRHGQMGPRYPAKLDPEKRNYNHVDSNYERKMARLMRNDGTR